MVNVGNLEQVSIFRRRPSHRDGLVIWGFTTDDAVTVVTDGWSMELSVNFDDVVLVEATNDTFSGFRASLDN